jgi:polar amino acid transport system ATP-binding protein
MTKTLPLRTTSQPDGESTKPIVRYQKVSKSFGDVTVLSEVDFDVAPGEKVAIIGPSGSGKTTLIRLLMTLEKPTSGMIEVDGEPLWHKKGKRKAGPGR